jgi:diguanylate cyclase (GGDEF)-like protein
VALLDIDHFKHVNDTYGHAAGDLVLRAVAAATRDECRSTDVAARLGGEELLLVLPATDLAGACVVAGRIRARIAEEPVIVDGQVIRVTASFGVACAPHQSSVRPADLVEAADRALYRAKRGGRNRVCVADGDEEAGTKVA